MAEIDLSKLDPEQRAFIHYLENNEWFWRAELKFVLPEEKMGRPSQGRTERLQFSTTPEIKQWLGSQRQQGETTSEVIHRLLVQQTYKS